MSPPCSVTCLLLTFAGPFRHGRPVECRNPDRAAWPQAPHVPLKRPSHRFLLVKQEPAGASRYPIIVRDLRAWSTADGTRLVLDLNHKASFSETHLRNPDRVVIEVNNAILGKSSRQRVSGGTIPQSFQIAQSRPRVVTITLTRTQDSTYKAFSLDNPDRLVIDITQRPKDQIRQIGETSTTSPSGPGRRLADSTGDSKPHRHGTGSSDRAQTGKPGPDDRH